MKGNRHASVGNYMEEENYMKTTKKEKSFGFGVESTGRNINYMVGNLTIGFPFICETDSKYITPFYLVDGSNVSATAPNHCVVFRGEEKEAYTPPAVDLKLKNLRVPTIALNISEKRYLRMVDFCPSIKELNKQVKPEGVTLYVPIIAFDENAVFLHQNCMKGDTIVVIGDLKATKITAFNRTVMALWVEDVQKVSTARRNMEGVAVM